MVMGVCLLLYCLWDLGGPSMALGATVPHWPSCHFLLLWQELWFVRLSSHVTSMFQSCMSRDCCMSPSHRHHDHCHVTATLAHTSFLPPLCKAKGWPERTEPCCKGQGLSFASWALPTPLLLHLDQALPRGAVRQAEPPAPLPGAPCSWTSGPSQLRVGEVRITIACSNGPRRTGSVQGLKPFLMNSQKLPESS